MAAHSAFVPNTVALFVRDEGYKTAASHPLSPNIHIHPTHSLNLPDPAQLNRKLESDSRH